MNTDIINIDCKVSLLPVTSAPPLSVGGFQDNLQLSAVMSAMSRGPSGVAGLSVRKSELYM